MTGDVRGLPMGGALEGIKVLDLTSYIAGPFATMLLGDLGAEIIKIEQPVTGDMFRRWDQEPKLYSPLFRSFNRNKKSATLNLASPEGKLPFELPSSMEAVAAQKPDVPHDSKAPLYKFGFGLRY